MLLIRDIDDAKLADQVKSVQKKERRAMMGLEEELEEETKELQVEVKVTKNKKGKKEEIDPAVLEAAR